MVNRNAAPVESAGIYGKGIAICPGSPGRTDTDHFQEVLLPELLPLEEYTHIIVLLSGGKDSVACYLLLKELGVPREKLLFFHHDIDGGNPERRMDWPVTQSYVRAFSEAEEVELCVSYRERGFFGELYRIGASLPVWYEAGGRRCRCPPTPRQVRSGELREKLSTLSGWELDELVSYGYRMKFPAKCGSLQIRWCSSVLKVEVANAVIRAMDKLKTDAKILLVSGERREESPGRKKYNEMELHETNAEKKAKRLVHQWRPVIDWPERRIWEIIRRHQVTPHPCYRAGWSRCSCMACIFSLPCHWAGIRELFPAEYGLLLRDEKRLHFTLDNKMALDEFTGNVKSCVCHRDAEAIRQLTTGIFTTDQIYTPYGQWQLPAGAFHGAAGGPC